MSEEDQSIAELKRLLAEDPSEEFLDSIASSLADSLTDSIPELSLDSRALNEVIDDFRKKKLESVDSKKQYATKIGYIETYFIDELGIESTKDLDSEDIERYKRWRKYESLEREEPLSKTTLRDDMYLLREFVEYLIGHNLVPPRFEQNIEIPELDPEAGEGVDEKTVDPELAQAAIAHLRKFHYADVEHVAFELFCHAGPRRGGLIGRNIDDLDESGEETVLRFRHRPDGEESGLKNDSGSDRDITLYGDLPKVIQDYIQGPRPRAKDNQGNRPLLTKGNGRISGSTLKKIAYKWTRPCKVGLECPHNTTPEECEAAQKNNLAYKCPSSRAPHHIRKGYITDLKNAGVSSEAIAYRCDVSPQTQKKYYDLPDSEPERERYDDEFRRADEDPDSGYRHG